MKKKYLKIVEKNIIDDHIILIFHIIINETNFNEYIKMPYYIINKYKNNTFSKTHFSDLLRLELLIKYGGT